MMKSSTTTTATISALIGTSYSAASNMILQQSNPSSSLSLSSEGEATANLYDDPPSNFSIYLKIIIGSFLVLVILVSIFGNILVCVAISSDRRLRRLGNLFIVSLAIADLCVGALVMTFALANDLLDYWPFGPQLCEVWIAFDISGSTCSIINLCAIALDRFAHIKYPMRYNRLMNKKIVIGCVTAVWLVSVSISFVPISLGWHKPDSNGQHEYTIPIGFNYSTMTATTETMTTTTTTTTTTANTSTIIDNGTSFESITMNNDSIEMESYQRPIYQNLYHLIRNHGNHNIQNIALRSEMVEPESYARISNSIPEIRFLASRSPLIPIGTVNNNNNNVDSNYMDGELASMMLPQCALDLSPSYAVVSSMISFYLPCMVMLYLYAKLYSICQQHVKSIRSMTKFQPMVTPNQNYLTHSTLTMTPSKGQMVSRDSIPNSRVSVTSTNHTSVLITGQQHQQQQQQQSHVTEHKAAITLGIIMGTFLACWMPFFCMNIISAYCKTCIPLLVFKILTWLGYFNSCLNPLIYSIFNTEFRDAFRRILIKYLFNGDTTAACSRLVPCKTPRSSTATMYGPGTGGGGGGGGGGGAAVGLNGNSLNTNFKANPFPVENVSNGINHSNLNETNIEKQEQQSSPQQQHRQQQQEPSQPQPEEEDVEVEMIFRRKSNESDTVPLHSPQNLQFCDHQSEANQSNLCNVSERPMATYVSYGPSNESTSFESDRPLLSGGTDLTQQQQQQQQQHQQPQHLCVGQSPSPSPSSTSSCGDKPQLCNEPENSISNPIDDQREVNGTQANQQQPFPKLPSSASSSSIRKMSQPLLNQNCRPIKRSEMFPKQQSLDHQHQHHHHHHHPHQHHHICVANRNRHSSSSSLNSIDSGTSNNDTDNSNGVIGGKGNGKWINRHNLKCQSVTSPTKVVNFHPHHGKIRSHNTPKIETNTPSPPPPQQNSQQNPQQLLANSDKRTPL